jgi:hypothetical protein
MSAAKITQSLDKNPLQKFETDVVSNAYGRAIEDEMDGDLI